MSWVFLNAIEITENKQMMDLNNKTILMMSYEKAEKWK